MVFSIYLTIKRNFSIALLVYPSFFCCCCIFCWCKIWQLKIFSLYLGLSEFIYIKFGATHKRWLKEIPHKKSESVLEKNQKSTKHMIRSSSWLSYFILQRSFFFGKVHNCLKLANSKKTFSIPFFQLGGILPPKNIDFSGQQNGQIFCCQSGHQVDHFEGTRLRLGLG